jgi:hypothetical protein
MKIQKTLMAATAIIAAILAFTTTSAQANEVHGLLFPKRASQTPTEQDKRLEHLPGKLSEAVKILREEGYYTNVSKWSEKDRGGGLSDGQISLDGDAGYPYSDGGFSDCNHIDFYTINYKRMVKDGSPSVKEVDREVTEKGRNNLFRPIAIELTPLMETGYKVTRVRVPGTFNSATEMNLLKVTVTEVEGSKPGTKRFVVETLEIRQQVYDHCSMRRD